MDEAITIKPMTHEPIETLTKAPLCAEIHQDDMDQSPKEWGDDNLFLVGFHRDFWVEQEGFSQDVCRAVVDAESDYDGSYTQTVKDIKKKYHVFPLEAYIHSGVVLALSREGNFPDRAWDVSQLGLVFVAKKEWRTKLKARKAALGLIETWNQYLSGDVYGYVIREEGDEEHIDSCWGFYGMEHAKEEAQSALDHAWEARRTREQANKKAEIINRVPLNKRTHSAI